MQPMAMACTQLPKNAVHKYKHTIQFSAYTLHIPVVNIREQRSV